MSTNQENNKRIAKNTLLLYFRMGIIMLVTLYTSRVVLNTLGVEDYGVYNVVGGIVAMFGFINSAMSSATSRYITFALGKNDERELHEIFCTCVNIHFIIALLILVFAESIGLWYVIEKVVVPPGREMATMWVYQCSVLSTMIMVLSIPYNACVIAHEKMSAFAYISVLEVFLKLLIVYVLVLTSWDKLAFYAILILLVQLCVRMAYMRYCRKHFNETKYKYSWNRQLSCEMASFASWSLFGNLAVVTYTTGLNLLLNLFFGPVVNAARAISVQVQNAVNQFIQNFQIALNPQITKSYAHGDYNSTYSLVYRSARFSFFLLMILTIPIQIEADTILKVWLKTVPEQTSTFLRIMMCIGLVYTLSNPLIILAQATGKIRKYQMIAGGVLLMILPISYVCLKLGLPAYSVFIVHLVLETTDLFVRMFLLRGMIGMSVRAYIRKVVYVISPVLLFSYIPPFIVYQLLDDSFLSFVVVCSISLFSSLLSVYYLGLASNERIFVKEKVKSVILKIKHWKLWI